MVRRVAGGAAGGRRGVRALAAGALGALLAVAPPPAAAQGFDAAVLAQALERLAAVDGRIADAVRGTLQELLGLNADLSRVLGLADLGRAGGPGTLPELLGAMRLQGLAALGRGLLGGLPVLSLGGATFRLGDLPQLDATLTRLVAQGTLGAAEGANLRATLLAQSQQSLQLLLQPQHLPLLRAAIAAQAAAVYGVDEQDPSRYGRIQRSLNASEALAMSLHGYAQELLGAAGRTASAPTPQAILPALNAITANQARLAGAQAMHQLAADEVRTLLALRAGEANRARALAQQRRLQGADALLGLMGPPGGERLY